MRKFGTNSALVLLLCVFIFGNVFGQDGSVKNPEIDVNPILPGYFADPTIKKFGDTYYIYATTDNEMLASGAPTVWYSKDLKHWYNYIMQVQSLNAVNLKNFWAPDIIEGTDGKYYLYFGNCQAGCNIYGYVSDTPLGPWEKLSETDVPVIAHNYPREGFPSLDAQFFRDDDGKVYAYWGTWVHYNGGYAVGELNTDTMASMTNATNIPLDQTPEPFEAAYMMKKGSKYILMYSGGSCHDETYNVRYAFADSPYGDFKEGLNNPILSSNASGSVHGPGHHSVLEENGHYYIVYHKHDYPMTGGGLSRQVCMDELIFENDSTLRKVMPGKINFQELEKSEMPKNLAKESKVTATSFYQLRSLQYEYDYRPEYATDQHNATLWKAGDNTFPQSLIIDLGKRSGVKRVMTAFEFASYYYEYQIEYSQDGITWRLFADRSKNRIPGSPMIDDGDVDAQYIKVTVLGAEKTGMYAAIWNIKVYDSYFDLPLGLINEPSTNGPGKPSQKEQIVALNADLNSVDETFHRIPNEGSIGGEFVKEGAISWTKEETGVKAFKFDKGALTFDKQVPRQLEWNGAFTVAVWVKNPQISDRDECLLSWCDRFAYNLANSYNALYYNSSNYGAAAHLDGHFDLGYSELPSPNEWHHIVLTFDGVVEKIYVDGILDSSQNMVLASQIKNAKIKIGASDVGEYFSGYMASLYMYDYALDSKEINQLRIETAPLKK